MTDNAPKERRCTCISAHDPFGVYQDHADPACPIHGTPSTQGEDEAPVTLNQIITLIERNKVLSAVAVSEDVLAEAQEA